MKDVLFRHLVETRGQTRVCVYSNKYEDVIYFLLNSSILRLHLELGSGTYSKFYISQIGHQYTVKIKIICL